MLDPPITRKVVFILILHIVLLEIRIAMRVYWVKLLSSKMVIQSLTFIYRPVCCKKFGKTSKLY